MSLWCFSNTLFKAVDRNQKIAFVVSHSKQYIQISLNTWIAYYWDVTVFENYVGSHNLQSVNPSVIPKNSVTKISLRYVFMIVRIKNDSEKYKKDTTKKSIFVFLIGSS